jgi:myosin heavy subunit
VVAKANLPNPHQDAFLEAKVSKIEPKEIIVAIREGEEDSSYSLKEYAVGYEDCQKLTYGQHDVSDMVDL